MRVEPNWFIRKLIFPICRSLGFGIYLKDERNTLRQCKKKKNVDVAQFAHQRALCNIPVGNKSCKHNNYLIQTYQMLRKSACFMYLNSKEKYIFLNHEISISFHLFYLPSNNKSDFWVLLLNSILEPCTVRHSYAQKQICVGRETWLFYSHCKFEATLYTQLPTLFTFLWLFKMSLSVF